MTWRLKKPSTTPSPDSSFAGRGRPIRLRSPLLAQRLLPWLRGDSSPISHEGRSWRAAQTTARQRREGSQASKSFTPRAPIGCCVRSPQALAPSVVGSDEPELGGQSANRWWSRCDSRTIAASEELAPASAKMLGQPKSPAEPELPAPENRAAVPPAAA